MIEKIYFIGIIIITLIVIYMYITNEQDYRRELDKIELLEKKYDQQKREIDEARKKVVPCDTIGLDNPRKCYFGSNYKCSWDDSAMLCSRK